METRFPTISFIICFINLAVFLFTYENIGYHAGLFGVKPQAFQYHSLLTYMFFHLDPFHLVGNMVMLLITGIVLEPLFKKGNFLFVYLFSGIMAPPFDLLGRVILNIPMDYILIGSSGAIFGLLYLTAILKSFEGVPTVLVLGAATPLIFKIFTLGPPILLSNPIFIFFLVFSLCFIFILSLVFIKTMPAIISILIFFLLWAIFSITGLEQSVSYFGHIGGIFGGMVSLFLMRRW